MTAATPTPEQHRILLVGNWLKRYSQIYPMYGKTLNDFPERFEEFLDEFRKTDPEILDLAFRAARSLCTEFPTPADVRRQIQPIATRVMQERSAKEITSWPTKQQLASGEAIPVKRLLESPPFKTACVMPSPKRPEVRQLTESEHTARINELKRQAALLQANETAAVR